MNRRGFFAALLAPVIARFAQKPKPQVISITAKTTDFSGWCDDEIRHQGDIICGSPIIVPSPRTGFRLYTPDGRF